jgi:murein tripeptide amidase MpaA
MAEFFMEGYIERLLDVHDPVARQLRKLATFYCVPNMCPGKWSSRSSLLLRRYSYHC